MSVDVTDYSPTDFANVPGADVWGATEQSPLPIVQPATAYRRTSQTKKTVYSSRSASSGSSCDARHAGIVPATSATATTTRIAPLSTGGSATPTPHSRSFTS